MKFRRRVKLFPGVTLNVSKSGISTTVGPRGINVNVNRHGTFLNTGIPGTGIYDRHRLSGGSGRGKGRAAKPAARIHAQAPPRIPALSTTPDIATSTTPGLEALRTAIVECHQERKELSAELAAAMKRARFAKGLELASKIMLVGFVIQWFGRFLASRQEECAELQALLDNCAIDLDLHTEPHLEEAYKAVTEAYCALIASHRIWDTNRRQSVDRKARRTTAGLAIDRLPVTWHYANLPFLRSSHNGLHFENATGADLYLYPAFMVLLERSGQLALLALDQLRLEHSAFRFIEEEEVPADAEVVDHTWFRANKDGSPDRRYKDNYQLPVCRYGEIKLTHPSGLDEAYAFSDAKKAEAFATALGDFLNLFKPFLSGNGSTE